MPLLIGTFTGTVKALTNDDPDERKPVRACIETSRDWPVQVACAHSWALPRAQGIVARSCMAQPLLNTREGEARCLPLSRSNPPRSQHGA